MPRRKMRPLASKHPAKSLSRLLGSWDIEVTFPGVDKSVRGSATCRWLAKRALLVIRSRVRGGPTSISVLGADDTNRTFSMLYSDDRGVTREYTMELTRTTWRLERRARRFSQRFIGNFNGNGRAIRGEWHKSVDGRRWQHDFVIVYKKR